MKQTDIINFIAIFLAPIFSVWIAQWLQTRSKKRDDKMSVFKTLMASRVYGWTPESVHALNIVEIVFPDNPYVIKQWKIYYEKLCIQHPDEPELKQIENAHTKLLLEMAKALGYKDKVTWETIQNPYKPKGMAASLDIQSENMNNYAEILRMFRENLSKQSKGDATNGKNENAQP